MSGDEDSFETELSALRPRGVSPELRRRIGDRLLRPPARRRWARRLLPAGVVIAATGLVLVALRWPGDLAAPLRVPARTVTLEFPAAAPALVAYQRALARSLEDLDALLDQTAVANARAEPTRMPVGMRPRTGATLDALLGDY